MPLLLVTVLTLSMTLAAPSLAPSAISAPEPGVLDDVPAPFFWDVQTNERVGGAANRFELDEPRRTGLLSHWYQLSYLPGGDRLRVEEHNPATTTSADSAIAKSQKVAWQASTAIVGGGLGTDDLPIWARPRTGTTDGASAGLLFTLADLDLLTPGPLAGDLRVAATGSVGSDGTVTAVRMVDAKVAAARLAGVGVVFSPDFPGGSGPVTSILSHVGPPAADRPIGDWLNTDGYEAAGRDAAAGPGALALVQVDDVRQALAWICGRTGLRRTCRLAHDAAASPTAIARPRIQVSASAATAHLGTPGEAR